MRIWVDTDGGADDALALLLLAQTPGVTVAGVCGTTGNVQADQAAANSRRILGLALGVDIPPVMVGQSWGSPRPNSPHGKTGIGTFAPAPMATGAACTLEALRAAALSGAHLLVLGPCTTVAAAERRWPGLLAEFASITVSGGLGNDPSGHLVEYPWARDANSLHDLAAVGVLAGSAAPVTWVGLDVTAPIVLERGDVRPDRAVAPALEDYGDAGAARHGRWAVGLHDLVAAVVATQQVPVSTISGMRMSMIRMGMAPSGPGVDTVITGVTGVVETARAVVSARRLG